MTKQLTRICPTRRKNRHKAVRHTDTWTPLYKEYQVNRGKYDCGRFLAPTGQRGRFRVKGKYPRFPALPCLALPCGTRQPSCVRLYLFIYFTSPPTHSTPVLTVCTYSCFTAVQYVVLTVMCTTSCILHMYRNNASKRRRTPSTGPQGRCFQRKRAL